MRASVRDTSSIAPGVSDVVAVGTVGSGTDWSNALRDIDVVVHTVARVHQMRDRAPDALSAHREVNTAGTERLARAAAAAGVRRLIYLSSVKVLGDSRERMYSAEDEPAPCDPYSVSKWEAELALACVSRETGIEIVVLRPPLVYGPGVKANFLRLLGAVARGIPLPFGAVENRRSMVYVGNLADAVAAAARTPGIQGRTYAISDGEDLSTPELIRRIGRALGRPARLFSVSPRLIRLAASAIGKASAVDRLLGSLTVDTQPVRRELAWTPPFSVLDGLRETAAWFTSGR